MAGCAIVCLLKIVNRKRQTATCQYGVSFSLLGNQSRAYKSPWRETSIETNRCKKTHFKHSISSGSNKNDCPKRNARRSGIDMRYRKTAL